MSEYIITGKQLERFEIPDFFTEQEIVRCRDCEYIDKVGYWCAHPSRTFIDEYGMEICNKVKPNGFCDLGEKQKNGGDEGLGPQPDGEPDNSRNTGCEAAADNASV